MKQKEISNRSDVLDVRDIIARFEELEEEKEAAKVDERLKKILEGR
jgi:hypothetical protein